MTALTNDKCFSSPSRHSLYPGRFFWPSSNTEVGEFSDVVNLDVLLTSAHFTGIRKQSFHEFAACSIKHAWCLGRRPLPPSVVEEEYPEVGDEWFLPLFSFHRHLEALHWAIEGFDSGAILVSHLLRRGFMLVRQCFG